MRRKQRRRKRPRWGSSALMEVAILLVSFYSVIPLCSSLFYHKSYGNAPGKLELWLHLSREVFRNIRLRCKSLDFELSILLHESKILEAKRMKTYNLKSH